MLTGQVHPLVEAQAASFPDGVYPGTTRSFTSWEQVGINDLPILNVDDLTEV